jgi:hypothetical protein
MGAILAAFLFILPGQTTATHVYRNSQCSYSFEYIDGWQIVKNPDYLTGDCQATLRPADYAKRMAEDDVDVYTLTVQVSEGPFLEVATENGFDFDGKWTILGREGLSEDAQVTNVNGWMTLQGIVPVGCFHEKGGNAGLCDEHRVVAKHQSNDRIVVITAGPQAEDPIGTILKTFKFLTR